MLISSDNSSLRPTQRHLEQRTPCPTIHYCKSHNDVRRCMCAPLCSRPFSSILFRHSEISLLFPHDQPQMYLCSHRPASWCLNRPLSVPSGPIQFPNSHPFAFRFDSDFLFCIEKWTSAGMCSCVCMPPRRLI